MTKEEMCAQKIRQRAMGSLVLPTHALWPVTVERFVRFNSH